MFRVLTSLAAQYDWRLVVAAGLVCFLASLTAIMLFNRARATAGRSALVWIAVAGAAIGCGIWATHFLAMLAYDPGAPVAYDVALTAWSLVAAVLVAAAGLAVAVFAPVGWAPLGGLVLGCGVGGMHYLGIAALDLPGRVTWDVALVTGSIVLGVVLSMAALTIAVRWHGPRAVLLAAVVLTLAIAGLHVTAMGAVEIVPDPTRAIAALSLPPASLATAVAGVAAAILGMSLIAAFASYCMDDTGRLLSMTLNNVTQGVVMFDTAGRLVMCNEQYMTMYRLSGDVVKPGTALLDIIRHRVENGSLQRDPAQYYAEVMASMAAGTIVRFVSETSDGRAVEVVNRRIPGSRYWVGTHDDITERRAAERKSVLLGAQEARRAVVEEAISRFQESAEGVLQTVADSVAAMKATATALSATSNETTVQTTSAVAASSEAFGSVEVAATAAEELAKSIAEISRQLIRASEVVGVAATEAQSTNEEIAGLAQAAQKIDDVVKLIQSVAGQTNLLALNAAIEAARAGAAGKGFAVVASEVKALAVQTAKATDDIAAQIAAVQASTHGAVGAIGNIAGRMSEIRQFAAAISTSVEQQNAATREISDSVEAAAAGTKSVVAVLQRVSAAIAEMHSSADTVLAASQAVEKAADSLRSSVDGFLRKVTA